MNGEWRRAGSDTGVRMLPLAPGLIAFAPICLLGNEFGTLFRYPDVNSALLFVPYAALTAALVASAPRDWIWYILVGSIAHFVAHWPQWSALWILFADVGDIARAVTAALLLRSVLAKAPRLDSMAALARFLAVAALIAPAIGATIGAADLVEHGQRATYPNAWAAWFMSNSLTGLTLLPAFVLAVSKGFWRPLRINRLRTAETIALATMIAGTCIATLMVTSSSRWQLALLLYTPFPVLIWAALRFGVAGASAALSAVVLAAMWGADRRIGPFLTSNPNDNVLVLQLFILLTSLPVLCIAAVSGARRGIVRLHRALLASLHDHVAILDARGALLEVNDSWRRFADEHDGAPFHRAHVGDDFIAVCRTAAEQGDFTATRALAGVMSVLTRERARFEMEYDDNRGGLQHRYALSVESLERSDGGAVVTRAEVTARRQAQMEIEDQRRALSHLARVSALGQLSGALAHELNQPLASIAGNAEAARHLVKRRPPDLVEIGAILDDIVSENQRAAHVIRRLRALLKRGETKLQPMDTHELVNEVMELAHAELITRRVTATASVAPNVPAVLGDRVQLQQVLLNLILNACEAMDATPTHERRLSLIVSTDARNNPQVSVRDRGTGIPPVLMDRLFEPFVTTKAEGLGLGLSISRTIVAAHGGRLWAENNVDRGATVHCVLVAAPPASVAVQHASPAFGNAAIGRSDRTSVPQ